MADPFGDKNNDADAGKRPTQTIEGTAEEIPSEHPSQTLDEQDARTADETALDSAGSGESPTGTVDDDDEPAAPPRPSQSGGGFFSHVMAGVIGGVIGVVALFLGVTFYPSLVTRSAPELEARLEALENEEPASAGVSEENFAGLQERVAKLESTIDSMADQAAKGGSVADAAAVSQQIDEAEKRLETKIEERLADLPKQQGEQQPGAGAQAVADLRQQIDTLNSEVSSLAASQAKENAGESVDMADLDALKERIAKLEGELPEISSAMQQTSNEARSAAITASLADLRTAVQSGGAYEAELADFKALAPAEADLSPLPAHAADGMATMPELVTAFEPASDKALATDVEPAEEGFFDTLLSSAGSVVKVRRLDGAGEGNSSEAILTRARAALEQGELDKAISEVETLKPEPKAAMDDWLSAAKARANAQATLKKLTTSDLAQSSDTPPDAGSSASPGL